MQDLVRKQKTGLVIKNLVVTPGSAPNDGTVTVKCRCTVFTCNDGAKIDSVHLDLRHTGLFVQVPLKPIAGRHLTPSMEGEYQGWFRIPRYMDSGKYRLLFLAMDSVGQVGRAIAKLEVNFEPGKDQALIESPEFRKSLATIGNGRFVAQNRIAALDKGRDALEKRLEMIQGAKKQINVQTYTFGNSGAGGKIVDALLKKAGEGVEVNIILNSDTQLPASPIGTLKLKLGSLLSQWVQSESTHTDDSSSLLAIFDLLKVSKAGRLNLAMFTRDTVSGTEPITKGGEKLSDHWLDRMLKDVIPESDRGFLSSDIFPTFAGPGGLPALPLLNYAIHEKILVVDGRFAMVGGRNLEDVYFSRWEDLDLYLEGPVVNEIQRGFLKTFNDITQNQEKVNKPQRLFNRKKIEGGADALFVQSRPWNREYHTLNALVHSIVSAKMRIYICSQYLVLPDSLLLDALLDAAGRGVDIRIMTNSYKTCKEVNFSTGYFISVNHMEPLLDAGIQIFERNGRKEEFALQPYFHVKEFLFDGQLAAGGSLNLSLRSSYIESENLLFVFDPQYCKQRENAFVDRCEKTATKVTPETLKEAKILYKNRIELSRTVELLY